MKFELPNPLGALGLIIPEFHIVTEERILPCMKCGAIASFTPCAYPGLCEALGPCQSDEEAALRGRTVYRELWPPGARPIVEQTQYLGYEQWPDTK